MNEAIELTDKQWLTWRFICAYTLEHHQPPLLADIQEHFGICKSAAHGRVRHLIEKGYLSRKQRKAGALRIFVWPKDWKGLIENNDWHHDY